MYFEQNVHCTLLKMDALYTKNTFKDYAKENERGRARWYFDFLFIRKKMRVAGIVFLDKICPISVKTLNLPNTVNRLPLHNTANLLWF